MIQYDKKYGFSPIDVGLNPYLKTYFNSYSRLFNQNAFFRSIGQGIDKNEISIVCKKHNEKFIFCIFLKNKFTPSSSILNCNLKWNECIRVTMVEDNFANVEVGTIDIDSEDYSYHSYGIFNINKNILIPQKSLLKVSSNYQIIKPICEYYFFTGTTVVDELSGMSSYGINISELRESLSQSSFVTMPIRGTDINDLSEDPLVYKEHDSISLSGGNGLPQFPLGLWTGPEKTFVHLLYEEDTNGNKKPIHKLYEWVGEDGQQGNWKTI